MVEGIEQLQYQEKKKSGFSNQLKEEVIEEAWGRQIGPDRSLPLPSQHFGGTEQKLEVAASKQRGAFTRRVVTRRSSAAGGSRCWPQL